MDSEQGDAGNRTLLKQFSKLQRRMMAVEENITTQTEKRVQALHEILSRVDLRVQALSLSSKTSRR